jgi:DNA-binding XRE family transcriptional regulator
MLYALINSRPTTDGRRKIHAVCGSVVECVAHRERERLPRAVTKIVEAADRRLWARWLQDGWMPAEVPLVSALRHRAGPPRGPQAAGLAGRIGEQVRAARKAAGITVEQAAERAGVDPRTWARWENGSALLAMAEQMEAIERGVGRPILSEELLRISE